MKESVPNEITENILGKLTKEVDKEFAKEVNDPDQPFSIEKFNDIKEKLELNEKSFKFNFPELNINLDEEETIAWAHDSHRLGYRRLKQEHDKLKKELFTAQNEIEQRIVGN